MVFCFNVFVAETGYSIHENAEKEEETRMKSGRSKQEDIHSSPTKYPAESYEILVQGQLDSLWGQWFEGMTLSNVENCESGAACTLISGPVADQPALHGMLIKIRDLNLKLISVRRILTETNTVVEIPIKPEPPGEKDDTH
jgi:hypothetical protein